MEKIMRFIKDEDGLETVEYAILLALIVVGLIVAVSTLGGKIKDQFNAVANSMG